MSKLAFSLWAVVIILAALLTGCRQSGRPAPATPAEDSRARAADGMKMVYVPGGEFRMGQTWSLQDRVHTVAIDGFWIDQTEVTNAHYRRCVEAGACRAPTACNWGEPTYQDRSKADHPVICITWQAASDYCRWAGGRLPTEAEWEYAARGPRATVYPWGDDLDGTLLNSCDVNCPHADQRDPEVDDGYALTAPAGSYPGGTSWCGALDMAGNVWEWVADWHAPYPLTRQTNPIGPDSGSEKLIRGGSWYENDEYGALRANNRHPFEPLDYNHLIGFRCMVPDEAAASYWPAAALDEQGMDAGLLAEGEMRHSDDWGQFMLDLPLAERHQRKGLAP